MTYDFALSDFIALFMVVALTAYALTGGADFGGGLWDLLASGPRRERQREHIATSLAPIWEANHVWLIVAVVVLFTGFPAAFSAITIALHIPLTVMLVGIVLRGSAFVFRSYGARTAGERRAWGSVFSIASVITPLFIGIIVGTLASGKVGATSTLPADHSFVDQFVRPWLAPFPLAVGLFALASFAFLAAVYLAYGADDVDLREDFRRRALASAAVVFVMAASALVVASRDARNVALGVTLTPIGVVVQIIVAACAITAIVALVRRRYRLARIAAAGQIATIVLGWAIAQFPYVVPDTLDVHGAAAPHETQTLLMVGLIAGTVILVPSLRYLYRLFARAHAH